MNGEREVCTKKEAELLFEVEHRCRMLFVNAVVTWRTSLDQSERKGGHNTWHVHQVF